MKRGKRLCVEGNRGSGNPNNQTDDNVPVECGSSNVNQVIVKDTVILTNFVPEDVWLLILGKMKNDDLENCINASPFIWKLRETKRTIDLFYKVVGIMTPLLEQNKIETYVNSTGKLKCKKGSKKEVVTTSSVVNWRPLVLKCRLVCSTWNKAVETCYEKPEMTGISEYCKEMDPRSPVNTMCIQWPKQIFCSIMPTKHPQNFVNIFERSHGPCIETPSKNPYFGRSVLLQFTQDLDIGERERDYNAFVKMLQLFGHQIWYCTLYLAFRFSTPAQVASKLQEILTLLPNLKYLSVETVNPEIYPKKMFALKPLPQLKNLEVLYLTCVGSSISNEIIRKNSHVRFLSLCRSSVDLNISTLLKNLEVYSTYSPSGRDDFFTRIGNECKLRKVTISEGQNPGALRIFTILHNYWAETLTDVSFEDPFSRDENTVLTQSRNFRLKLPNVRRLSIRSFHAFFIDFVLPMQNLEHLQIYVHARWIPGHRDWDRVKKEQTIKLIGFRESMHLSKVWNFFSNLKTIEFVCVVPNVRDKILIHTNEGRKLVYFKKDLR